MAVSPRGTKLYRNTWRPVILAALVLMLAQMVPAQTPARKSPPKGPRALGLLQLLPNGKAHLIPITILYDGEFYDASAYKASPVPMALESGTVYEGFRSGVSQGLFTVSSALQGNDTWVGNGTWKSASAIAAAKAAAAKKKEAREKLSPEPVVGGPPVLRRRAEAQSPEPPPSTPPSTPAPAPAPTQTGSAPNPPNSAPAGSAPAASAPPTSAPATPAPAAPAAASAASTSEASPDEEDPDRPVLKRGASSRAENKKPAASTTTPARETAKKPGGTATAQSNSAQSAAGPSGSAQSFPAISDATNGPDPHSYIQDVKPDEEAKLRQKVLALAADEVRARAAQLAAEAVGSAPPHPTAKPGTHVKLPQPTFEDVQLHIFDLSSSNEPVLVLTAKARMPSRPNASASAPNAGLQYMLTLVARDDIYDELHKAFVNITDTQHMDVLPRMELIDAVDADGDGRGELLFRQISDAGKAFVLYRVIGDQLWPLFQGTPGP